MPISVSAENITPFVSLYMLPVIAQILVQILERLEKFHILTEEGYVGRITFDKFDYEETLVRGKTFDKGSIGRNGQENK